MHDIAILATSAVALAKVQSIHDAIAAQPQINLETQHVLHAGTYARTIKVPAGVVLAGVFIKIPTLLILDGVLSILIGDEWHMMIGRNVLPAGAGRKQAFAASSESHITMIFATNARTVAEAEAEFTDQTEMLMSRKPGAFNEIIGGPSGCLEQP